MMMMIIYGRDIDDDEEVDSRDGMVMMAEIEIVTEGGDELEIIITYIVKNYIHIVIITSYPSSLLICINIKHYIHHHCLYVSISNTISIIIAYMYQYQTLYSYSHHNIISINIIAYRKLIDTSSPILQCSSQHLFRSHSIVLDYSDENGI